MQSLSHLPLTGSQGFAHTEFGPNSVNKMQDQIWICLCLEIRLSKEDTERRDRMVQQ